MKLVACVVKRAAWSPGVAGVGICHEVYLWQHCALEGTQLQLHLAGHATFLRRALAGGRCCGHSLTTSASGRSP